MSSVEVIVYVGRHFNEDVVQQVMDGIETDFDDHFPSLKGEGDFTFERDEDIFSVDQVYTDVSIDYEESDAYSDLDEIRTKMRWSENLEAFAEEFNAIDEALDRMEGAIEDEFSNVESHFDDLDSDVRGMFNVYSPQDIFGEEVMEEYEALLVLFEKEYKQNLAGAMDTAVANVADRRQMGL